MALGILLSGVKLASIKGIPWSVGWGVMLLATQIILESISLYDEGSEPIIVNINGDTTASTGPIEPIINADPGSQSVIQLTECLDEIELTTLWLCIWHNTYRIWNPLHDNTKQAFRRNFTHF